jgi:anthranilate synthase component 2
MAPILIIDNYDSFTYNLYQCAAQYVTEIHIVRNDRISVSDILQMRPSGIILSPGPGRPEKSGICVELLQTLKHPIPILGVCLGHQAIVAAFGGKVVAAPEIIHGKEALVFHNNATLYQHLPQPFTAGRYHSLLADKTSLPETLVIDAETSDGLIMGVHHLTLPIFGVQFHPESILTPDGHYLVQNFLNQCQEVH